MRFHVRSPSRSSVSAPKPYAVLNESFDSKERYRTAYRLEVFLESGDVVSLGEVRIMQLGMRPDVSLEFRELPFTELPSDFYSLGQQYTYYEDLIHALPDNWQEILSGLHDVVYFRDKLNEVQDDEVFHSSLIFSQTAERALFDASELVHEARERGAQDTITIHESASVVQVGIEFAFRTNVGGDDFVSRFVFGDLSELPNRTIGIIGYNGVGKTKLLANLAMVAQANRSQRRQSRYLKTGEFDGEGPLFGAVVAISFSAFDDFEFPSQDDRDGSIYAYCGLRDPKSPSGDRRLKPPSEIRAEFLDELEIARSEGRKDVLASVLSTLGNEPSFGFFAMEELYGAERELSLQDVTGLYDSLSTGHKIIMNIAVRLVARLQLKSLILIDEPESHLHPPLVAALMRAVSRALQLRESFALVATHSPVVIQEIPGRYVKVLNRVGATNSLDEVEIETFGENVGQLTTTVFSLDSKDTDYHDVLRRLATTRSLDEIDELFDGELPAPARAFVASLKRRQRNP